MNRESAKLEGNAAGTNAGAASSGMAPGDRGPGDRGRGARLWWQRLVGFVQPLLRLGRRPPRRLRLCESLPLGERRFVAVVEFDRARFLVGGTTASLVLLARLGPDGEAIPATPSSPVASSQAASNQAPSNQVDSNQPAPGRGEAQV
jgi:Flagellar biosynthesis protein, FliO